VSDLLAGLAGRLAAAGRGTYSTTDPYTGDVVGIVLGGMPAAPDRAIAITTYAGTESSSNEPYDTVMVQIRVRGTADESVSRTLAQAVYDDLHGLGITRLPGGALIVNAVGQNGGPIAIGTDANNRHEHVVNLRVEHHNPTALRPA
jgi:hypothetical protein